jgi:hypothetical protein
MPFNVVKVRSGFKVQDDKGRYYSKKLLTKEEAREQQKALYAMERRKAIEHHPDGRMDFTYRRKKHELKGTGFFSNAWSWAKKAGTTAVGLVKKASPIVRHIKENIGTYSAIGRQISDVLVSEKLSPPVQKWLDENKDGRVVRLILRRAPIESWIEFFFSLITDGKWDEAKKTAGYDKMFHLALEVHYQMPDGRIKRGKMEKLSRVNFTDDVAPQPNMETQDVPIGNKQFTILDLVEGAKRQLGNKFYTYDAFNNNCQVFVRAMLEGVGLYTPEAKAFLFQPVDELLKEQPSWTSDFAGTITNLGAITDRLFKGGRKRLLKGSSANKVVMPFKEFEAEHKKLIHLLRNPDPAKLKAEADEQEAELKKYSGKGKGSFQEDLQTMGIDPKKYLKEAQKRARSAGYSHLPQFASNTIHKLEVVNPSGKIVRFGRRNYGDNIVYTFLEATGKVPKGTAEAKRKSYLARATKIKGDWKADDYSPNSLAVRILWNG